MHWLPEAALKDDCTSLPISRIIQPDYPEYMTCEHFLLTLFRIFPSQFT